MRSERGLYKVGATTNPYSRLKSIQTHNSDLIELVTAKLVSDTFAAENKLHKLLKDYKANGGREWFKLTPEQALNVAIELNKSPALGVTELELLQNMFADYKDRETKIFKRIENMLIQLAGEQPDPPVRLPKPVVVKPPKPTQEEIDNADYLNAIEVVKAKRKASTSLLQRELRLGYGKAARIIDRMEKNGIVSEQDGSRPRQVLVA